MSTLILVLCVYAIGFVCGEAWAMRHTRVGKPLSADAALVAKRLGVYPDGVRVNVRGTVGSYSESDRAIEDAERRGGCHA